MLFHLRNWSACDMCVFSSLSTSIVVRTVSMELVLQWASMGEMELCDSKIITVNCALDARMPFCSLIATCTRASTQIHSNQLNVRGEREMYDVAFQVQTCASQLSRMAMSRGRRTQRSVWQKKNRHTGPLSKSAEQMNERTGVRVKRNKKKNVWTKMCDVCAVCNTLKKIIDGHKYSVCLMSSTSVAMHLPRRTFTIEPTEQTPHGPHNTSTPNTRRNSIKAKENR